MYQVKVRDEHNNATVMFECETLDDAKEEEEVLRINYAFMYIWIEVV